MNRVEKLISELCPNGAVYLSLGCIEDKKYIKLGRGNVISKTDISDYPGNFPVYSSSASGVGEFGRYGKYMFDDEMITWSIDGGGKFFFRPAHKYSVTNVSGWLKVLDKNNINIKFLYYVLIDEWGFKTFDYTKKAHPSVIRDEYKIPIPPLEVQEEIVKILDSFTELEAELVAELVTRKRQYDYYKRILLDSKKHSGLKSSILEDEVFFSNGKGHEACIVENGKYIVVNSKFISTDGCVKKYSNNQLSPVLNGQILMVMSDLPNGKALAKCYYAEKDNKYTLNQRICSLSVKNLQKIYPKYLFYVLNRNIQLLKYDNGVDQTNLRKDDILKIEVDFPDINVQKNIVSILDKFDALVNDISIGLPAELKARRQQYEYYRNKLLAFKELKD